MNTSPVVTTCVLFDLQPGADPERHPVARFRAVAYEGGPPPAFVPEWEAAEVLSLALDWRPPESDSWQGDPRLFLPRRALGAIDGLFRRRARWVRRRIYCNIACVHPQGQQWIHLRRLYRMFEKPCPWRLKRMNVPPWAREEVRLC